MIACILVNPKDVSLCSIVSLCFVFLVWLCLFVWFGFFLVCLVGCFCFVFYGHKADILVSRC